MATKLEKIAALKKACETDLRFLAKTVLGMTKWDDTLHRDLEKFLKNPSKQKLILMPRGHLKTSLVTVAWVIQQVLINPNIRILINNAVWDNARKILDQISDYLTTKSLLPEIYGPFKTNACRWTRDEIEVAQKTDVTKRGATVSTGGVETAQTGMHFDLIVHDDLVERNNVGTRDQIQKVITFYRDSLDLLDPGGRMVVIGTRWALGDLYGFIMDNEMSSLNGTRFKDEVERSEWRKCAPQVEAAA